MPDDQTERHPLHGKQINIADESEIANWHEILEVTREDLLYAVRQAGPSSKAVSSCNFTGFNM